MRDCFDTNVMNVNLQILCTGGFFQSFQPHYGPKVDSASNRYEYQESSWGGKKRPARRADNLTDICEPIV
jgi:hypothetical protein